MKVTYTLIWHRAYLFVKSILFLQHTFPLLTVNRVYLSKVGCGVKYPINGKCFDLIVQFFIKLPSVYLQSIPLQEEACGLKIGYGMVL